MRVYRPLLTSGGRMATITIGSYGDAAYLIGSAVFGGRRIRFVQNPPTGELLRALSKLVEIGSVKPVVDSVTPVRRTLLYAMQKNDPLGGFPDHNMKVF